MTGHAYQVLIAGPFYFKTAWQDLLHDYQLFFLSNPGASLFFYSDGIYHLFEREPIERGVLLKPSARLLNFLQQHQIKAYYCQTSLIYRGLSNEEFNSDFILSSSLADLAEQCLQNRALQCPGQLTEQNSQAPKDFLFHYLGGHKSALIAKEGIELAFMLAAYGLKLDFLLVPEALNYLTQEQPELLKMLSAYPEYDIEFLYLLGASSAPNTKLLKNIKPVDSQSVIHLLKDYRYQLKWNF